MRTACRCRPPPSPAPLPPSHLPGSPPPPPPPTAGSPHLLRQQPAGNPHPSTPHPSRRDPRWGHTSPLVTTLQECSRHLLLCLHSCHPGLLQGLQALPASSPIGEIQPGLAGKRKFDKKVTLEKCCFKMGRFKMGRHLN